MYRRISILRDKAGDNGADGGGGEAPPAFTDAQLAVIGQTVNSAITSHAKRQKPLADELKALDWKSLLSPVVTELLPRPDEGSGGGDAGGGKAKGGKGDDAMARQLQDLASKLEASEKARAEEARLRSEAETQRHADRANSELRNLLQPKVRPELLDVLGRDLARAVKVDPTTGAATLTVKRAPYKGAPEQDEDLPLAEAVPHWLTSENAKVFLPPPGAGNAPPPRGGRAPHVPNVGGSTNDLPADPAARTLKQFEQAGIDPHELFE